MRRCTLPAVLTALAFTLTSITSAAAKPHQPPPVWAANQTAGPMLNPHGVGVNARQLIALPKTGVTATEITAQVAAAGAVIDQLPQDATDVLVVGAARQTDPAAVAQAMVNSGLYRAVDYNGSRRLHAYTNTPDDPKYATDSASWGLKAFPGSGFNQVWAGLDLAAPADTVPVAVVDTGLVDRHEDRGPNLVGGWNYADNNDKINPVSASDSYAFGHGTATAGLIGAATNNAKGIAGAAWDSKVVSYKTLGRDGELADDVLIAAINGAAADGAKIISMSFGGPGFSSVWKTALDDAIAHGIILIASAGNEGPGSINYPAYYGPVISVSATNSSGEFAWWSSANDQVDIAAPGESIRVMVPGGYDIWDGTSFSCPFVAAGAALVWRYRPDLTAAQVAEILTATTHDITTAPASLGWDMYTGAGLLDVKAAVDRALNEPLVPHIAPATTYPVVTAGQAFELALHLTGDPTASVSLAKATALPAGLSLTKSSAGWRLSGTATKAGRYPVTVKVSGNGQSTELTLTLTVNPTKAAAVTVIPSAQAAFSTSGVTWTVKATDLYGNTIPDAANTAKTTASFSNCRFPTGQAPSRRVCVITASYAGKYGRAAGSASVDIFDLSVLKPVIRGPARVGTKLTVTGPVGWPNLTYQWFHNGRAVATGTTYTPSAGAVAGDAVRVDAKLAHRGLTTTVGSPSVWLSPAPALVQPTLATANMTLKATAKGIKIKVKPKGIARPTGKIRIKYGKYKLTKTLKASNKGVLTVKLKHLKVGKKTKVTVTYLGTKRIIGAKATIKVTRH